MPFKKMGYPCDMAKNKRDIDAQGKREEIAAHALDLFLANGYEATSMAMISSSASIAANTIYWYFQGKDEVFVAALDKLTNTVAAEFSRKNFRAAAKQMAWVLQELGRYRQLISTVHARLAESAAVR